MRGFSPRLVHRCDCRDVPGKTSLGDLSARKKRRDRERCKKGRAWVHPANALASQAHDSHDSQQERWGRPDSVGP